MILRSNVNWTNIFKDLKKNVIYCINDSATSGYVLPNGSYNFCSDECFIINWTKIDFNNERCLESCLNSSDNKYEYESVCYNKCPEGKLLNDHLCEDNYCDVEGENPANCIDGRPFGYYFDNQDGVLNSPKPLQLFKLLFIL